MTNQSESKPVVIKRRRPTKHLYPPKPLSRSLKSDQNLLVTINLTARHEINGTVYGPGPVRVPRHIAADLQSGDQEAIREEIRFRSTRSVIIQAGPRGRGYKPREVPPETFDIGMTNDETTVDVKTVPPSGIPQEDYGKD